MRLTGTSNSIFSKKVPLSPSYISRLRNGKRPLPNQPTFLPQLAQYFSHQLNNEDWELLGFSNIPKDKVTTLLGWLTSAQSGKLTFPLAENKSKSEFSCLFGNDGKRTLVIRFFKTILNENKKQTLLLYSDENMDWLKEDQSFALQWKTYLRQILESGHTIKIIHTLNRNLDEMFTAIQKWLPLYMTGQIEPFYCPKIRDGLFQQTLFIASSSCAIVSSSITYDSEYMPNYFFSNKEIIFSLQKEYNNLLKLCKPIITKHTQIDKGLFPQISSFVSPENPVITAQPGLPWTTLPDATAIGISSEYGKIHKKFSSHLCALLESQEMTEIITLPTPEDLEKGLLIPFTGLLGITERKYYTKDLLLQHFDNTIRYIRKHKSYMLVILPERNLQETIYIKQDNILFSQDNKTSSYLFSAVQANLIQSFWTYLSSFRQYNAMGQETIIEELERTKEMFAKESNN
jgi:hypothetical protein